MPLKFSPKTRRTIQKTLGGSHMLAFIPILTLGAYWAGGEYALTATAIALPVLLALLGGIRERAAPTADHDPMTGLILRDALIDWVDITQQEAKSQNMQIAVIGMSIDDLDTVEERFGRSMRETVLREACARVKALMRDDDVLARLGDGFALGLSNVKAPETENLMQLAHRVQTVFAEPFSEGPTRTYCTLSMGIAAESHVKGQTGSNIVVGAQRATELAAISGPGSIRVYNEGLSSDRAHDRDVARELSNALETGEIFAWFQPQTRAENGDVTGFEALARWDHPERGLISPASFLPDIEKSGLSQRLAEVILKQSLMALNAWDAAGFVVETVSVNFSSEELRNPRLPDYVRWELDRHGLETDRLVVEVLESVAAESSEDIISRNLNSLSRIGCRIDLDDFGTGFTSFVNIRRFDVSRIKIDRSLVSQVDTDSHQGRMLSALLAFSNKLGIDALAEGVETEGEIAKLRELGCQDIQGFAISRPLPLGETLLWLEDNGRLASEAPSSSVPKSA